MRLALCMILSGGLLFLLGAGCSKSTSSPSGALSAGEQVTLIDQEGDFGLVALADGERGFVPLGMLKQRNTAEASDADHTHAIVRATDVYDVAPSEPIAPPQPRIRAEIDHEQKKLNALFIGEETGKEVIAPGDVHYFVVDQETGERCWRSIECIHPNCQGEKKNGRPYYVFFLVAERPNEEEPPIECDACRSFRDPDNETPEELTEWSRFVRPYELPETLRRRDELDLERKRFVQQLREQLGQ